MKKILKNLIFCALFNIFYISATEKAETIKDMPYIYNNTDNVVIVNDLRIRINDKYHDKLTIERHHLLVEEFITRIRTREENGRPSSSTVKLTAIDIPFYELKIYKKSKENSISINNKDWIAMPAVIIVNIVAANEGENNLFCDIIPFDEWLKKFAKKTQFDKESEDGKKTDDIKSTKTEPLS
jgi:hypothetical protein